MLRRAAILIAGLLGAAAVGGCSTTVVRRSVERRLERRLAEMLGPADRYHVRITDTRDSELVLGRVGRVEIEGRNIRAKDEFLIDWVRLTLVGLQYESGDTSFVSVQRSDLEVEFTDRELNKYLTAHERKYQPHVRFEPDQVHVRMVYKFLGTPVTINAAGRLVIREGRLLTFEAESTDLSFINSPGFGERFVEDRVNPLFDLSRLDFPARLESIQLFEGRIKAHGSAAVRREVTIPPKARRG